MPLPAPHLTSLLTAWTPNPVGIVVGVALAASYATGLRRLRATGRRWPPGRTLAFGAGVALLAWTECGFLGAYSSALFWVWTTRVLLLWLIVPIAVLAGRPVDLARTVGAGATLDRLLRSRPVRTVGNPLIGPALVPVLSGVLFFGPLAGWAIAGSLPGGSPAGWLLDLVLLAVGAAIVVPLVGLDEDASSLAVGLGLAIGSFELVLDALPGIVLRLHTTLATSWFTHRDVHSWSPDALHDQQLAGAILWCLAEVLDLPFLLLAFRRWLRADARDAAQVDAVLDAERIARGELSTEAAQVPRDAPWWESDPVLRERYRRG